MFDIEISVKMTLRHVNTDITDITDNNMYK